MRASTLFTRILLIVSIALVSVSTVSAKEKSAYQTGFDQWRAAEGGFANGWEFAGVFQNGAGELEFTADGAKDDGVDPYPNNTYYGINFYNGGTFSVGTATGPWMTTDFPFYEAIASWNASTPPGTWIEVLIQARIGGRETKEYNLGVWASGDTDITRHSVRLQGDADGYVAVDTLVLSSKSGGAEAYRLKVRLFSVDGSAKPTVRNLSLAYSTTPTKKVTLASGNPDLWGNLLAVPECSQMVYPDGGEVWCSPTSTSMVLSYWGGYTGPCEPVVRATVDGVYDVIYDGHGNWPFNTAYAATQGYEGYVARFTSLAQAEPWIAAGVPVIVSFAWGKSDLTGAAIPSSGGHLAVLVGFDNNGNPIINDPAAASDADVQRTYNRVEFETLWLEHSGGTVYLIYPPSTFVP